MYNLSKFLSTLTLKSIGKDKAKYEAVNRQDEEEDFGGLEDEMEMANADGGAL